MSFAGPIIRQGLKTAGKYVYQGLRQQERIIDYTYRRTGLYNRGVVRGIKHGLAGGQIIGGGLSLGLNAPDSPGNDGIQTFQPRKQFTPRKSYKTRGRQSVRYCRSNGSRYSSHRNNRYTNSRRSQFR